MQLNPEGIGEGFLHDYAVFYPRVHVLPSGKLLIVQPLYTTPANGSSNSSGMYAGRSLIYDADAQAITASFPGPQNVDPVYVNPGYAAQFTTSALLPLLPESNYLPTVLICGAAKAARATVTPGSEWNATYTPTSARPAFFNQNGAMVAPLRANATAILLPTGQVFVSGGMNIFETLPAGQPYDQTFSVFLPEIYDPVNDVWTALTDAPASVARGYHSNALLMLDGRVLTAGSERNNVSGAASAEYRMEVFEPDYIAAPNRLTIQHVQPAIAYGETFSVEFQLAPGTAFPSIDRVAIMRFGSATHSFDYDQRYVGLTFQQTSPGVLSVVGPPSGGVAPPGYYMLWLIDSGGLPCVQAATVRVGGQRVYVETDRSVFSIDDVKLNFDPTTKSASSSRAVDLVFEGYHSQRSGSTDCERRDHLPGSSGRRRMGNVLEVQSRRAKSGDRISGSPQLIQRIVLAFDVVFDGTTAFDGITGPDDIRVLTVTITAGPSSASATIDLVGEPTPFMTDGTAAVVERRHPRVPGDADRGGALAPELRLGRADGFRADADRAPQRAVDEWASDVQRASHRRAAIGAQLAADRRRHAERCAGLQLRFSTCAPG